MKIFSVTIFLGCIFGYQCLDLKLSGRVIDEAKEVKEKCMAETGAPQESLDLIKRGDMENHGEPYKCFLRCFMNHFFTMDAEGNFDFEEELKNVPPEIKEEGHRLVHLCKHTDGKDPCDKAFEIHKCYFKGNTDLYRAALHVIDEATGYTGYKWVD